MSWWRDRPHECPLCGWQGMREPSESEAPRCSECDTLLQQRSWTDTWGLTLLILGAVVAAVLFVAYGSALLD